MKFKIYRQLDASDCGATCIKMVAKHYGRNFDLAYLRDLSYLNRDGAPLLGLNDAAERIGFRCTAVRSSFDKFVDKGIFPCIVHWRETHYVVVYKVKVKRRGDHWVGKIYVADPAYGRIIYTVEEFLSGWKNKNSEDNKGIFLLLVPTLDFYKVDIDKENISNSKKLSYFFYYLKPYRKLFIQVILGMLLAMSFTFIMPFLSQAVVDLGIMNNNIKFIYLVLISQLILSTSELAVSFIQSWILLHTTGRINIALISDFIAKMLKLPISFFNTKSTGDIMQRIGDHSRIQDFFTSSTIGILFSFVSFFIFAIILGYYNLQMLIVFLVGHALYVGWILSFMKIRRDLDFKRFDKASRNQSSLIEIIKGAEEIKLSGAEQKMRNKWEFIQADLFKLSMKGLRISQIQTSGSFFLSNITNISLSALSAYLVINGEITLGMMMSLSYILGQLKSPISSFIGFVHSLQDAKISVERLSEIHFQEDEDTSLEEKDLELPYSQDIQINDLTFSYMGDKVEPVLKNIDLKIPRNQITAIVGESGSGKTTLIKLILGYFEPQKGNIFIGSQNLKKMDKKLWRMQCSAVMQDGFIFSTTVSENISISDHIGKKEQIIDACKKASVHDFIEQMPAGYNTKIGEQGSGISQGQKQRILIARAIYKNSNFIFLDEATNALDANNEKKVIGNLNEFLGEKTAIIIAHRLSTVKNADQIVVLDKGEIAEIGNHDDLIQKRGKYFNLVKNQLEL